MRRLIAAPLDAPWGSTYYKTEEPWVQNWTEALKLCTDLREVEIRPRMGSAYPCTILEFKRTLDYLMSGLQTLAHLKTLTLDLLPPYHSFPTYIANSARPFVQFGDLRSFSLGIVSPHERDLLRRVNESLLTAGRLGEFRLTVSLFRLEPPTLNVASFQLHLSENAGFNSSSFPECCEALKKVTSLRIAQTSTRIPIAVLLIPVNLSELTFKYSHGIFVRRRMLFPRLFSSNLLLGGYQGPSYASLVAHSLDRGAEKPRSTQPPQLAYRCYIVDSRVTAPEPDSAVHWI